MENNIASLFPLRTIPVHASREYYADVVSTVSDETIHPSRRTRLCDNSRDIALPVDARRFE